MRLRELLHILWVEQIDIMAPEVKSWVTIKGNTHGPGSAISRACKEYGDRDVEYILVDSMPSKQFCCTISLF